MCVVSCSKTKYFAVGYPSLIDNHDVSERISFLLYIYCDAEFWANSSDIFLV